MNGTWSPLTRRRIGLEFGTAILLSFLVTLVGALVWLLAGADLLLMAASGAVLLFWQVPRTAPDCLLQAERVRRLSPAQAPQLTARAAVLAHRAGLRQVPRLYVVPSSSLNAFTLELSQGAAIVLSDGLLRRLSLYELTGVLAHEMSHIRRQDVRLTGLANGCCRLTRRLSVVSVIGLLWDKSLVVAADQDWAILLILLAPLLADLARLSISRLREFQADLGGAALLHDAGPLSAALVRMASMEGGLSRPRVWLGSRGGTSALLHTHPATDERILRLSRLWPVSGRVEASFQSLYKINTVL